VFVCVSLAESNQRSKVEREEMSLTPQEIQPYLDAYNRLSRSWTRNRASADAKAKGMYNYESWFKSNGIKLQQDARTREWKIVAEESSEQ
jgi:hypothetical protein